MEQARAVEANLKLGAASEEDRLLSKVRWRILPLLVACFVAAYFDRVNISFAKLQMQSELGLSNASYGLGASLFFIEYLLFEIPSNLILVRVGARRWIARIMITWGFASAAMMFARSEAIFYTLRILLGALEAGFVPGVIYLFTQWVPAKQRASFHSLFFASSAIAGIIGGPLSGGILKYMDTVAGLSGWQWLFLIEGLLPVVLGLVVLAVLDDRIADAKWLTAMEKTSLAKAIADDNEGAPNHSLRAAFTDPLTYLLSLIYVGLCIGVYGIFFWMPHLVKAAGTSDPFKIGLITTLPYCAAIIGSMVIGRSSDRTGERRWHLSGCLAVGVLGYAICATFGDNSIILLLGLCVATTAMISSFGLFWLFPPRVLGGVAAAGGLALINSVGQLGGVIAPYCVGLIIDSTGSASIGLYAIGAVCAVTGVLIAWGIPRRFRFRDVRPVI